MKGMVVSLTTDVSVVSGSIEPLRALFGWLEGVDGIGDPHRKTGQTRSNG